MKSIVKIAIIRNQRIMLVKKGVWTLPGKDLKDGETDLESICREINENFPIIKLKNCQIYSHFYNQSIDSTLTRVKVYTAEINEKLTNYTANPLINVRWIKEISRYEVSETTLEILNSLKKEMNI